MFEKLFRVSVMCIAPAIAWVAWEIRGFSIGSVDVNGWDFPREMKVDLKNPVKIDSESAVEVTTGSYGSLKVNMSR